MIRPALCQTIGQQRRWRRCAATPRRPVACGCALFPATNMVIAPGPGCGGEPRPNMIRASLLLPAGMVAWLRFRLSHAWASQFIAYLGNAAGPVGAALYQHAAGWDSAFSEPCRQWVAHCSFVVAVQSAQRLWLELQSGPMPGSGDQTDGPAASAQLVQCIDLRSVSGVVPSTIGRVLALGGTLSPNPFEIGLQCGVDGRSDETWPLLVLPPGSASTVAVRMTGVVPIESIAGIDWGVLKLDLAATPPANGFTLITRAWQFTTPAVSCATGTRTRLVNLSASNPSSASLPMVAGLRYGWAQGQAMSPVIVEAT